MFIFDDIALSPFKGLMFLAKEIAKAADQAIEEERNQLMAQLTALHRSLENGEISEDDFDQQEAELLERLESMQQS